MWGQPSTSARVALTHIAETEAMEMLVTPGKQDLQNLVEGREGGITVDKYTAPDQGTGAP